jgi:hypothetical protein
MLLAGTHPDDLFRSFAAAHQHPGRPSPDEEVQ